MTGLLFGAFIILPKLLFNLYKFNFLAYKHLFKLFIALEKWIFFHPFKWPISEIILFTSRKKFRHHGMGRKLMDTFMETVRSRNYKEALVCTDTAVSYKFYESYGFTVFRQFKQNAYKYSIPGKPFTGLIYNYDLKEKNL